MAKSLITWMKEIKQGLDSKGHTKDIPLDVFRAEVMILSGYNRTKVIEWINNFELCKLITIKNNIVNWK